jgi:hypothetical protein
MDNQLKNEAALSALVRELTSCGSFDVDEVRFQCYTVIYTCLQMGIEPSQLPIGDNFSGDLSEIEKWDFLHRYLLLQMERSKREEITLLIDSEPAWLSLVHLIDEVIATQSA